MVLETQGFSFSENFSFLQKTLRGYCQIIVKAGKKRNVLKFVKAELFAPIFMELQFLLSFISWIVFRILKSDSYLYVSVSVCSASKEMDINPLQENKVLFLKHVDSITSVQ